MSEKVPETKTADYARSETLNESASRSVDEKAPFSSGNASVPEESQDEIRYPGETHAAAVADLELKKIQTSEEEYPTGVKLSLITLALCLSVFLMALDNTIIATAIPKITDEFSSLSDVGWYGSGKSTH